MTADTALNAVKAWIEHNATGDLADVPIVLRDTDTEKPGLQIVIAEDGDPEEHPVLRGVLTIQINVMLRSVPGEEDEESTTQADHQALNADLYDILADVAAITYCDAYEGLKCFDIRGAAGSTSDEDGLRVTTFPLTMVACKRT